MGRSDRRIGPALAATPLIRPLPCLAALCLLGCGATPTPPPAPTLPDVLPHAALMVQVQPRAVLTGLDAIRERMTGSLGPIAIAWSKAEQALGDAIASLLPGRTSAPSLLAEWGIDDRQPMRLEIAAPEASRMGRALLDVLSEREPQDPATVVVQARWHLGVTEPDRLMQALGVLSARIGFDTHRLGSGPRPAWIGAEPLAPTVRWIGRDPQTGTWGCLQVLDQRATFDLLVPPKPGPIAALVRGLSRSTSVSHFQSRGAQRRPLRDASAPRSARRSGGTGEPVPRRLRSGALSLGVGGRRGPQLQLTLHPAEMAALEAALSAHVGLRHPTAAVREASAEVLKACTERWQAVARFARVITASFQVTPTGSGGALNVRLTPDAQRIWAQAVRPVPTGIWGPAAWRIGWDARGFGRLNGPGWIEETARCEAGHPLLAALGAFPILPRVLPPQSMPLPPLLTALPWTRVDGAAAAIVDAAHLDGLATPVLAGLFRGAGPKPVQPLGPEAVEVKRDGETRWRAVGGAPVEIGYRPDRIRVGLGPDAWRAAPPADPGVFLDVVLDAQQLAARLRAAGATGSEVQALAAVGERFGTFRAQGRLVQDRLRLTVSLSLDQRAGQR